MDILRLNEDRVVILVSLGAVIFWLFLWVYQTYNGLKSQTVENIIITTVIIVLASQRFIKEAVRFYRDLQPSHKASK